MWSTITPNVAEPDFSLDVKDLVTLLRRRAELHPNGTAYVFLVDGETPGCRLTFSELDRTAKSIAARLQNSGLDGQRALLLYPPGLEYIAAFFGCLYARVIPVPAYPPSGRDLRRLQAIVGDASPAVIMTLAEIRDRFQSEASIRQEPISWLATDQLKIDDGYEWVSRPVDPHDLALLQYTSGSTGNPRGVMVSHINLLVNQALIKRVFGHSRNSTLVGWLPLYHDMGLIGNILQPLYVGSTAYLMSPLAFLEKPLCWLQAISTYRAHTSGGPNFAFDYCVRRIAAKDKRDLDLSSWTVAFNGAEPIRASTLERFASAFAECGFQRERFLPCYGLAEATLLVTAPVGGQPPSILQVDRDQLSANRVVETTGSAGIPLVGCGQTWPAHEVRIVNPASSTPCLTREVGEIWVSGPSVAQGYWNRPDESEKIFQARISGEQHDTFLRTGDLGFIDEGSLFITGRLKDLIIIAGRNHYPLDFECVLDEKVDALRSGCSAAFSVTFDEQEKLVIVAEPQRSLLPLLKDHGAPRLLHQIHETLAKECDIAPGEIVLVQPGSVPKTSSGKIRRGTCRQNYLDGTLSVIARSTDYFLSKKAPPDLNGAPGSDPLLREALALLAPEKRPAFIERFLVSITAKLLRIPESHLSTSAGLVASGIDSLRAVELKHALDALLGVEVPLSLLLTGRKYSELAVALSELLPTRAEIAGLSNPNNSATHGLSHAQMAMWAVHQLEPSGTSYNLHLALRVEGYVDHCALRRAFDDLIMRHPVLRTSYFGEDGRAPQANVSVTLGECPFAVIATQGWTDSDLQAHLHEEIRQPFDLRSGPVLRGTFYARSEHEGILLLCANHIALDLWSLLIILKELQTIYDAHCTGRLTHLPNVDADYQKFVIWEQQYLKSPASAADWAYWQKQLGGALPVLTLPTDHPRPQLPSNIGSSFCLRLDASLTAELRSIARAYDATLFTLLLAAYKILLFRYTHQRDIIVGSASSGRGQRRFASVVGNFVNPIALRTTLAPDQLFSAFLGSVRSCVTEALSHQDLPFSVIVDRLHPERSAGQWPIFQTWFALQQAQSEVESDFAQFALGESSIPLRWGELTIASMALHQRIERFDLKLMAAETRDDLVLSFQYRRDLFEAGTIARLAGHFQQLIQSIVAEPEAKIAALAWLTPHERHDLLNVPSVTDAVSLSDSYIHHFVDKWAATTPDTVALTCSDRSLTFMELDSKANQLANFLRRRGVDRNVPVGLCIDRSSETVVAIFGILKAGGVYVPIDPDLPPRRILDILENAGVNVLVCRQKWLESSGIQVPDPVFLDAHQLAIADELSVAPAATSINGDLAYIIYTSGSTGHPKGVAVTHRSLVNYIEAILRRLPAETGLNFAFISTFAADLGHTVLFSALASGNCLHVLSYDEATDPRLFGAYMRRHQIDILKIVPSHYSALVPPGAEAGLLPRRALIFGGEALPANLVQRVCFAQQCDVFNHYGPTEATVGALILQVNEDKPCKDSASNVLIGKAIENVRAYVLGPDLALLPIGVSGEICLAGAGLAQGYFRQPDLTAERFVPDPYASQHGERLYRTGDLGRVALDGSIEFLGRFDQQVKIRGFRIELGEIEAYLRGHSAVEQGVAAILTDKENVSRLIAYVVLKNGARCDADTFQTYLGEHLPDYMIPSYFVLLDALPITRNGKIDRKQLPVPDFELLARPIYRAPRNDIETSLVEIYSSLLGCDRVGIDDNFFALGGDSILSIQAASRAHAAGLNVSPRQIFLHQSVSELAHAIGPAEAGKAQVLGLSISPVSDTTGESFPLSNLSSTELSRLKAGIPDIEDIYPLTPLQDGLLFHTLSSPNSGIYIMQHRYWIEGEIDIAAFEAAWRSIVNTHSIFRTSFVWDGLSHSQQIVHRTVTLPIDYIDWRQLGEAEQECELSKLLANERRVGFDLSNAPLIHIRLFHLKDNRYLLIRSHHHILFDAWCTSLILSELRTNYLAVIEKRELPLRTGPGFREYIAWLRRQDVSAAEAFWRAHLRDLSEPIPLIGTRPSEAETDADAVKDIVHHLSEAHTAKLKSLSQRYQITPNTFMQAALALLLAQYTSRREVLFGVTVAGRPAELRGVDEILGLFINGLPLRISIDLDQPLPALLRNVLEQNYAIRDYEYVSLTQVHKWSEIPHGTELFQYLLTFENAPVDSALMEDHGNWRFTDCLHRTHTNYPFTFVVIPGSRLHIQLTYDRRLVDEGLAGRLLGHYVRLLEGMVRHPEARLGDLVFLGEAERHQLVVEWNATTHTFSEPRDLIGRFEAQVLRVPDAVAASCGGATLSYQELNERANWLAHALIAEGVGPDSVIAVLDERGLDFLVMMLAIFKAGGGYLPLDPAHPDGRIGQVLTESGVNLLLAGAASRDRAKTLIAGLAGRMPRLLDLAALEASESRHDNPPRRHAPANLAFVIYTSGSTGKPKGALVEHQGMFNNLITKVPALGLTSEDVIAQTASQCFDISVWQFLTALVLGARVEIFPDAISRDPLRLSEEIALRGVTILEAVPSMIRALLDASETGEALAGLRWLLPCGEAFAPELCRSFMERHPKVRLLNAYGPVECSDDVSYYPIETPPAGNDLSVPIGRPVDNTRLYLLNRWLEPVPVGVAGEICVGGVQVGRGYLNRPDLTAERFVPDPFGGSGDRLYRTGDLGRYREDGVIEFLGRVDHQVKIRGHRIEPGEVEAALTTHPRVHAAAVVARPAGPGIHRLVAYVVGVEGPADPDALRQHLRATLPDYMIPSAFVTLEALPLTPNGKIDRNALPEPDLAAQLADRFVAPRNPTEEILAQIWADVLRVQNIGINDNFFELGGHSLLATRIVSKIRAAFAVDLPLRTLFETSTLAALAPRVDDARGCSLTSTPAPLRRRETPLPASHAQKRLWFMHQLDDANPLYHFTLAVQVTGPLDSNLFEASLNAIIQRHESLRTVLLNEQGDLHQSILSELKVVLQCETLESRADEVRANDLHHRMREFIATPFDLAHGPLVRASLYRLSPPQPSASPVCVVVICFHHIVFDGWSLSIFLKELATLYLAMRDGHEPSLPPLPVQYPDYTIWQRERMQGEHFLRQLDYWTDHLKGATQFLDLPVDRPRSIETGDAAGSHEFNLSEQLPALEAFNRQHAVTPFMTILAAFAGLLRYLSGATDLVVGADVANRPQGEFEPLIGFFVNLVALRIKLDGDPRFSRTLTQVREMTLSAYDHQECPFDKLVEELRPERSLLHAPIFQVKVVYHNVPSTALDIPGLAFDVIHFDTPRTELDLVLHIYEGQQELRGIFEYRSGLFEPATIRRFAALFGLLLRRVLSEPGIRLSALVDFLAINDRTFRAVERAEELRAQRDKLRLADRRGLRVGA